MMTFLELFPLVSIIFASLIIVLIGYSMFLRSKDNLVAESTINFNNVNDRIAPFIKVHRNFASLDEQDVHVAEDRKLDEKIKDFRLRNRFYCK